MFVEAIEKASAFTFPLIISNRYQDGSISSSLGSFIILNEEGWLLTAAHIIQETSLHQAHLKEYQNYIHGEGTVLNPKWILNHSLWFGADHHRVQEFYVLPENDLAIGKIENFNPAFVREYPVFISPGAVKTGRSVCKLGFPFYDIQATFSGNAFRYDPGLFPIPRFPYEGMVTRIISGGFIPSGSGSLGARPAEPALSEPDRSAGSQLPLGLTEPGPERSGLDRSGLDGPGQEPAGPDSTSQDQSGQESSGLTWPGSPREILWIETSSPGLRGQSGGPVFDTKGRVWGIQSMTRHLPLGFSPSIQKNGITVEENQFINLGWFVHIQAVMNFLDQHGITYYRAEETA